MTASDLLDEAVARAVDELQSPADFVRFGAQRFIEHKLHFGHGTDNAADEARWLVLHALNLDPGSAAKLPDLHLTRPQREQIAALIQERIRSRRPAAYLTGEAWFAGHKFFVDERVLVPRSPLAEWIEQRFEPFVDASRVHRILDLGTGSGCIAIACAFAFPEARVDASDLSEDALEVAMINVKSHGVGDRVRLIHSDGFNAIDGRYDLIVSNPPYVPEASYRRLPEEYRHEPERGLAAGPEGLDLVTRILRDASEHMNDDALLVVEVGEARDALEKRFLRLPFLWLDMTRGGDDVFALTREELGRK